MIWCVEDDASIRDIELYALRSAGLDAEGFPDGDSFWQAIQSRRPELVVLDVMLPGIEGTELLRRMRHTPELRQIPVIMATAKGAEYDRVQGLDSGADDYLVKPFSVIELVSRVRAVLRRCQPAQPDSALRCGTVTLDTREHTVTCGGERVELTYKDTSDDDKEKTVTFYVGSKDDSATYYYVQMDGSQRVSRVLIDTVEKALGWKVDSSAE